MTREPMFRESSWLLSPFGLAIAVVYALSVLGVMDTSDEAIRAGGPLHDATTKVHGRVQARSC